MNQIFQAKKNGSHLIHEVHGKYGDIREAVQDAALRGKKSFVRFKRAADAAISEGADQVKITAVRLDRKVKKNPWAVIGGATLGALVVGYFIGRTAKKDGWE